MPENDTQIRGGSLHQRQSTNTRFNGPTIICDGIQTPENFGSILRVADAAGCQKVILLDSELDTRHKKLSRLARSTDRHIEIEASTLELFLQNRHRYQSLFSLEITEHSKNMYQQNITSCDGIIIGHESRGVRDELLQICKASIHLPMFGVNGSMNLSHSLALFLFEWRRQKGDTDTA